MTVATDGASLYESEQELALARYFPQGFDAVAAAGVFGEHLLGAATDNLIELNRVDRERIFNLGYYTWVEQQGISLEDFEARRRPEFWSGIHGALAGDWDALIDEAPTRAPASWSPCDRSGQPTRLCRLRRGGPGRPVSVLVPERPSGRRRRPRPATRPRPLGRSLPPGRSGAEPFVRFRAFLRAYHVAIAGGLSDREFCTLVLRLDAHVADVDGHGFATTPFARSDELASGSGSPAGAASGSRTRRETSPGRTRPGICSVYCSTSRFRSASG